MGRMLAGRAFAACSLLHVLVGVIGASMPGCQHACQVHTAALGECTAELGRTKQKRIACGHSTDDALDLGDTGAWNTVTVNVNVVNRYAPVPSAPAVLPEPGFVSLEPWDGAEDPVAVLIQKTSALIRTAERMGSQQVVSAELVRRTSLAQLALQGHCKPDHSTGHLEATSPQSDAAVPPCSCNEEQSKVAKCRDTLVQQKASVAKLCVKQQANAQSKREAEEPTDSDAQSKQEAEGPSDSDKIKRMKEEHAKVTLERQAIKNQTKDLERQLQAIMCNQGQECPVSEQADTAGVILQLERQNYTQLHQIFFASNMSDVPQSQVPSHSYVYNTMLHHIHTDQLQR